MVTLQREATGLVILQASEHLWPEDLEVSKEQLMYFMLLMVLVGTSSIHSCYSLD